MKFACDNPKAVADRAFWLAFQASEGPPSAATEEDLLDDYPVNGEARSIEYARSRTLKLTLAWEDDAVIYNGHAPNGSWKRVYPSVLELLQAAQLSLVPKSAVNNPDD